MIKIKENLALKKVKILSAKVVSRLPFIVISLQFLGQLKQNLWSKNDFLVYVKYFDSLIQILVEHINERCCLLLMLKMWQDLISVAYQIKKNTIH